MDNEFLPSKNIHIEKVILLMRDFNHAKDTLNCELPLFGKDMVKRALFFDGVNKNISVKKG